MYLVLMAMLALNVSAEIMNAFLSMDKSITNSNGIVDNSNGQIFNSISKQVDAYKQYKPYLEKAEKVRQLSSEMDSYISELRSGLFTVAGGPDPDNPEKPLRYKDKDIPTKFLVEEGRGEELKAKVLDIRAQLLALVEDEEARKELEVSLPLDIAEIPAESEKKTWAAYSFEQMPVVAVLPIFSKLKNDVKTSETAILSHFYKKANGETPVMDEFEVVVSADQGYVIQGEEYSGEVFLGAYSSTNNNITATIDGRSYPVRGGKASFSFTPSSIGTKNYEAVIRVKNPLTGEVKSYKKKFKYEVGKRSVAVGADKMNVLYVGVKNPISVSAAGVKTGQLKVNASGTPLNKINENQYIAEPKKPGKAVITVSGGGLSPTKFEYRVKKIPDPVVYLGKKRGGSMSPAEFKAHQGPVPILENFDFDARCKIDGFELVRLPDKGDPAFAKNSGGKYKGRAKDLVKQANFKDSYFFNDIKVRCPGDDAGRNLGSLAFTIK